MNKRRPGYNRSHRVKSAFTAATLRLPAARDVTRLELQLCKPSAFRQWDREPSTTLISRRWSKHLAPPPKERAR